MAFYRRELERALERARVLNHLRAHPDQDTVSEIGKKICPDERKDTYNWARHIVDSLQRENWVESSTLSDGTIVWHLTPAGLAGSGTSSWPARFTSMPALRKKPPGWPTAQPASSTPSCLAIAITTSKTMWC